MQETFLSNYDYFSCQSSSFLLFLEVFKNHYQKENISVYGCDQVEDVLMFMLNSCKTDLDKLIYVDFGKPEFLNINIFNWYEALY